MSEIDGNPADTVAAIDAALTKVEQRGLTDVRISLSWPHYRDLLALRGLPTDPKQRDFWGTGYERRPIKQYRKHTLRLVDHASQVVGKDDRGHISARVI